MGGGQRQLLATCLSDFLNLALPLLWFPLSLLLMLLLFLSLMISSWFMKFTMIGTSSLRSPLLLLPVASMVPFRTIYRSFSHCFPSRQFSPIRNVLSGLSSTLIFRSAGGPLYARVGRCTRILTRFTYLRISRFPPFYLRYRSSRFSRFVSATPVSRSFLLFPFLTDTVAFSTEISCAADAYVCVRVFVRVYVVS